jgi:hypothetical protein
LLFGQRKLQKIGVTLVSIGAFLSFLVPFWWSIRFNGDFTVQPWNCVIGFSISSIAMFIAFRFLEDRPIPEEAREEG